MKEQPNAVTVTAAVGEFKVEGLTPTPWLSFSWAPIWHEFAWEEAERGATDAPDWRSRAREMIFACCCAEAFLFEWVRDDVLQRQFTELETYFRPGDKKGLAEKWRELPKRLAREGRILKAPALGDAVGQEWRSLIDYRNGLVHARASRPESPGQPDESSPKPTVTILMNTRPAWAIEIVAEMIRRLCAAAGTPAPSWLRPVGAAG